MTKNFQSLEIRKAMGLRRGFWLTVPRVVEFDIDEGLCAIECQLWLTLTFRLMTIEYAKKCKSAAQMPDSHN